MAVTTTNLIQGPANLYAGAFGSTEPTDSAFATVPTTPFVDCGATDGGVTLNINQEYTELEVDQLVDVPERRMTKREFSIATSLAEPTLENLSLSLNHNITTPVAAGTGATSHRMTQAEDSSSATQPQYSCLIMDGYAPAGLLRRFLGRKMLNTKAMELAASKSDKTLLEVEFTGHYVSPSIKPFKIIDQEEAA